MGSTTIHIAVSDEDEIFVGTRFITKKVIEGVKIVKEFWQHPPADLKDFLFKNKDKDKEDLVYNALSYWAACIVKKKQDNENAYGTLKRELHEHSQELYKAVRSFARHIATEIQKLFLKKQKEFKKLQKLKRRQQQF